VPPLLWFSDITCSVDGESIVCTYSNEGEYVYHRNVDRGITFERIVTDDNAIVTIPSDMVGKEIVITGLVRSTTYHQIDPAYINGGAVLGTLPRQVTKLECLTEKPSNAYQAYDTIYLRDQVSRELVSVSVQSGKLTITNTES